MYITVTAWQRKLFAVMAAAVAVASVCWFEGTIAPAPTYTDCHGTIVFLQ